MGERRRRSAASTFSSTPLPLPRGRRSTGASSTPARDAFAQALDVSAYSLVALARGAEPLMGPGGSIMSLTYYGAEKVIPHYNVMGVAKAALEASTRYLAAEMGPQGIRVNAISAGPIKTLSGSGIAGFRKMLHYTEERTPLRRNVDQDEVGRTALWLCSDLASGVTGEIVHVDAGYNILGHAGAAGDVGARIVEAGGDPSRPNAPLCRTVSALGSPRSTPAERQTPPQPLPGRLRRPGEGLRRIPWASAVLPPPCGNAVSAGRGTRLRLVWGRGPTPDHLITTLEKPWPHRKAG